MSEAFDMEAGLAKLMAWAGEDIPDYLRGASGAELADLAGADLAFMAGEVAEALESFRDAPFEVTEVVPVLGGDDQLAPAVMLTANASDGTEVEIIVRLTGREAALPEPGPVVLTVIDECRAFESEN